ncbi:hypothetical protein SDC9_210166 [bioreactor metagenome]|uniref:Uncharacterized protein n=1 Tax=bioreactor metagenome TaxID=1076179 RepID=A0A645JFD8_9ZZZZ
MFVIISVVTAVRMDLTTTRGLTEVWACKYKAATPLIKGAAIEVPLRVFFAVVDPIQAESTSLPGAKRSRQAPWFE